MSNESSAVASTVARPMVVVTPKNTGIAILLTCLIGPLGLFYASVKAALIVIGSCIAVSAVLPLAVAGSLAGAGSGAVGVGLFAGFGLSALVWGVAWLVSIPLSAICVSRFNKGLGMSTD